MSTDFNPLCSNSTSDLCINIGVGSSIVNRSFDVSGQLVERSPSGHRRDLDLNDPCFSFRFFFNAVVIGLLCVVGLTGNTVAIYVLRRDRKSSVAAFLLQSLAAADNSVLCVSFVLLSVFYGLLPSFEGGSEIVVRALPYLIKYANPVGPVVQSCSIWITVLLSVNRYVAVCKPFSAPRVLTMKAARLQVAAVVVLSIGLNIPRIFNFDIIDNSPNNKTSVVRIQRSNLGQNVLFQMIYFNVLYTWLILILPLILLVVLNVLLVRQLQASKERMKRNSLGYSGQSENDITVVMIMIVLALVICHTPDRILQVVHFFSDPTGQGEITGCPSAIFYVFNLTTLLIIISSFSDFIFYYVFRRRFRVILCNRVRKLLRLSCNTDQVSGQTEETGQDVAFVVRKESTT